MAGETHTWKAGDLVQLKPTGPVMAVQFVEPNGLFLKASWFSGKKHEQGRFATASLQAPPVDDDSDS